MKAKQLFYTGIVILFVSACGGSSGSGEQTASGNGKETIKSAYQGVWQAPAYGVAYNITNNSIERFHYTSNFCLKDLDENDVTTQDLETLFLFNQNGQTMENYSEFGSRDFHAPAVVFHKEASLPSSCEDNLIPFKHQQDFQADATTDMAYLYELFKEYYVDFQLKSVDWEALYQTYQVEINNASTELELLDVMYDMLAPLSDSHVNIATEYGNFTHYNKLTFEGLLAQEFAQQNALPFPIPAALATPTVLSELGLYIEEQKAIKTSIIDDYAEDSSDVKSLDDGMVRWFSNEGIGYLYIGKMHGLLSEDASSDAHVQAIDNLLDTILDDLGGISDLIIDLRDNQGGTDLYSLAIASRFVANETLAFSKQARLGATFTPLTEVFITPRGDQQFLGDIVLLTSATTTSSAEKLALALRALPNVTLVGEATHGALSYRLEKTLPNGFEVSLSNERYLSHDGLWFEASGIPVDVEVPYSTLEQRNQEIDLGIETAVEVLRQ